MPRKLHIDQHHMHCILYVYFVYVKQFLLLMYSMRKCRGTVMSPNDFISYLCKVASIAIKIVDFRARTGVSLTGMTLMLFMLQIHRFGKLLPNNIFDIHSMNMVINIFHSLALWPIVKCFVTRLLIALLI